MRPSASWPTPARGVALRHLVVREVLERAEDRLRVPHEHRAAAERRDDARPGRLQDQTRRDRRADGRLGLQLGRARAGRHQDGAVGRDHVAAADGRGGHVRGQVDVRRGRRERLQRRPRPRSRSAGVRAPYAGVKSIDLPGRRGLVDAGERSPLAGALPGAEELDAVDVQRAGRVDADRRARGERRVSQHAAGHEDAARVTVRGAEEIAVDARDGRGRREVLLHLRHALLDPEHRVAGKHGRELVEAVLVTRPRRLQHVHDDGAVRRELHRLLVGDARHQRHGPGRLRRRGEGAQQQEDCQ